MTVVPKACSHGIVGPVPTNRSAPRGPVIPVLTYPDVRAAVDWMVEVLGFVEQVWIGPNHRAQLSFGDGSLIVADATRERVLPTDGEVDPWDHRWTLTQTLRDVAPEDWGGRSGPP